VTKKLNDLLFRATLYNAVWLMHIQKHPSLHKMLIRTTEELQNLGTVSSPTGFTGLNSFFAISIVPHKKIPCDWRTGRYSKSVLVCQELLLLDESHLNQVFPEPAKEPPVPSGRGVTHVCSWASCCVRIFFQFFLMFSKYLWRYACIMKSTVAYCYWFASAQL